MTQFLFFVKNLLTRNFKSFKKFQRKEEKKEATFLKDNFNITIYHEKSLSSAEKSKKT
jgi:hypothetical protein